MMKKLIKYEMRSMLRLFLPLWPSLILLSIINHFTLRADFYSDTVASRILEALVMILMFLYVVLIMAIGIVALIVMIRRFYVGLLRDEGYLMFTLPVKTSQIIWSKLISAVILTAITGIVCMISVFIMALDKEVIKENASMIMRYLYYVSSMRDEKGLTGFGLGDWCDPFESNEHPISAPLDVVASI
ncbi:MAG: hypothetical protein IIY16_00035, partial [Oscillospiraceae bacterium]|nr:hypothetical protein [Oscillospiraceae bacterium]